MTLSLQSIQDPQERVRVRVFHDDAAALEHIRDHLLTGPESDAWGLIAALIAPELALPEGLYEEDDARSRQRVSRQLFDDSAGSSASLYVLYRRVIEHSLHGWRARCGEEAAAFGLLGVIVFIRDLDEERGCVVRTAYVVGAGAPLDPSRQRNDGPLLRREAPRGMRRRPGRQPLSAREARRRRRRRVDMTLEARVYHEVYKEALRELRRQSVNALSHGRARPERYAALDGFLLQRIGVSGGRLCFDEWSARLRQTPQPK